MSRTEVELQDGNEKRTFPLNPLPAGEDEPVAYMVSRMRANKPIEGLTAIDINTKVINIIDLANLYSCSFIAVDDIGFIHQDGGFEVSGRVDNSDIRGCSLMVV